MPEAIANVAEMVKTEIPIFGNLSGHQILALSQGIINAKCTTDNRGINHR